MGPMLITGSGKLFPDLLPSQGTHYFAALRVGASHLIDLPVGLCKAIAEHRRFRGYVLIMASLYVKGASLTWAVSRVAAGPETDLPEEPGCRGYAGITGRPGLRCFRRPLLR